MRSLSTECDACSAAQARRHPDDGAVVESVRAAPAPTLSLPARDRAVRVGASAEVRIARPREEVFDLMVSLDAMPELFTGEGPVPGVVKVEVAGGGPLRTGAIRRVTHTDGSVVEEVIVALERPLLQCYRLVSGFRFPFSLLVREGAGTWTLLPDGTSTRVRWELAFDLTTALARPLARRVIEGPFRSAMQACLERMRDRLVA